MNWTHRIKSVGWAYWYLIDLDNPTVCVREGAPDRLINLNDGWLGRLKESGSVKMEELNISLENE